ncbi:MAG: acyl carrier protein [Lentisphaerae bacterium]|nr:acyl carrier protein [Lentisphaerota bacterium]
MTLDALVRETLLLPPEQPVRDEDGPGTLDAWDSMGHVNIIDAVENAYGISLTPDEILTIRTVTDIKALLHAKGITAF